MTLMGGVALMFTLAAPVAAAPTAASAVVIRVEATDSFGVLPDFENEYWVFTNVTRNDFCLWFDDPAGEPFPTNLDPSRVQVVVLGDVELDNIEHSAPTFLHAFTDAGPFAGPCAGSEEEAALSGDLRVRVTNNDALDAGQRANAFGDRGHGTVTDASGSRYHYSWNFTAVASPDDSVFKITTERFNLQPIGG
jgi:hypothetical protein